MKINSENTNLNLRHLQALHAIDRAGSFAAAAAALGVVPSALSEVIRQIEDVVGAPLYDRSTRPPVPTPLARQFLQDTAPVLEGMDRALHRLRQAAGLETGTLSIGASPSAISELIAPALAGFLADKPAVRCTVHDDIAERLADLVVAGQLDLAIAGRARHSADLRQHEILRDRFGLACAADHPLAARDRLMLADIDPASLIAPDAETGSAQLLAQCAAVPDSFRTPRLRAHSTVAQLCMIRAGLGVALLPENAVTLFRDPAIRFLPVADLDLTRTLYLLEPARRPPSDLARAFVRCIESRMAPR